MTRQHPIIHGRPGRPFGDDTQRVRPCGRIGGVPADADATVSTRLAAALGSGAQVLTPTGPAVVADFDACRIAGRTLATDADWRAVLTTRRMGAVEGAFAAAWTDSDGTLHLARDAVGERTLYCAEAPAGPVFASSIRAILATGLVPRRVNLRAVATYLSYAYLPGRETLVEGVHELLPGECVSFGASGLRREVFWELPALPRDSAGEEELTPRLRQNLEDAVRARLPATEEPVGAFLSGGLDSSLVVALARRLHPAPVHTYSVFFGDGYANELPFSSLVADHCGTDHRVVELSPAAVLHHLDDAVGLLSDPIGDPLTVPNALLFREAAERVGIVLNGEGGDPCFGGPKNLPMLLAELYPRAGNREASYLRAHLKCYDDLPAMLADPVRDAVAAA
ncbi:MAG TPA: asparagine synthase-related protein, partial [Gemmataceae bacterium]|nr:asparagine synthase-related protein [Gemmataceae bacterium]